MTGSTQYLDLASSEFSHKILFGTTNLQYCTYSLHLISSTNKNRII
uniref:Uncharacterized protein n=1 Tax=Arundo donax TaxID=35708 RepID=A0A0A9BXV6_ARUDO